MPGNLPGGPVRPLAVRSADDRGPGYLAAVEQAEAAFAAVRSVLGDQPRLPGNAGELAALLAAVPPETQVLVAEWPRVAAGAQPGDDWVWSLGVTVVTYAAQPVLPVRDNTGQEYDLPAPALELAEYLLPGPDAAPPAETQAIGDYARAVESLEAGEPGPGLRAVGALLDHIAGLIEPGSEYSPAGFLPAGHPAAAAIAAETECLRHLAARIAAIARDD